ncbi:MAG: LEA type 2 family protein [Halapricum sp.]
MDLQQSVRTARDRLPSARTAFVAVLVSLGLIAVLLTALVATGVLAQPTVESIDKGWGTVSDDSTEIEAQVVVDNPNPVGIPGILTVEYTASMNDVVLAENTESGIGLSSGENTIVLSSKMPNDRIADWWVTHVNNDERSTLTIDPSVRGAGFSPDLPNETSTIETDLLSSFGSDGEETATLDGEPLMVIGDQSASWGQATDETTPISFTSTVENVHDAPVTLDGVEYVVKMNDVTLGEGRTDDGLDVQPGEMGTLTVDAALETPAFADWWPTHVRDDETSQMTVELYGLVERNGTRTRVPIALDEQRIEFQTDLMGDGGTTVESLPTERDTVTVPTVAETERRWGTIRDDTAEVVTTVELDNTEDLETIRNVTTLAIDRSTSINDVTVLDSTTNRELPAADEPLTATSEMDNSKFADWWTRHVNRDERSTVVTEANATVDVGITTFERPLTDEETLFETDILGTIGSDGPRTVTVANETLVELGDQRASWGTADAETTPFTLTTVVENRHDRPITFDGIEYTVTMNDVPVANGTSDETLTVDAGETDQLETIIPLSTPRLSEWWVSHLRADERSNVSVQLHGVVERDGDRERVPIALIEDRFRLTTDLLGEGNSTVESLPVERADIEEPTVEETTRQWSEVTDATTEVLTTVTIDNPNTDPEYNEFVRLTTTTKTAVNDVPFGAGEQANETLSSGTNDLNVTSELDNGEVPEWWARHLNAGERSIVNTTVTTMADVGFTTLSVATPDRNSTFETDLLADLNTDEDQPIEDDGETLLVAESTSVEWGEATAEQAPLDAESVVRNEQPVPITVEKIDYTVSINGIVLSDDTHVENTVIQPGATATIRLPMTLDNSKMDQWWVTHVPEERSNLNVDATATISVGGDTRTVPLEMFSEAKTFETDILG